MDSQNNTAKKQRNPKNQRDRRKTQDKENDTLKNTEQADSNNTPAPQPQRANRRQRNETVAASSSPQPTPTVIPEKKDSTEAVTVDFSNLKRETDEIAKLTKKFAKREISSNWHKYSVPEGPKEDAWVEDGAPADFSELLHVSLSGGGHLQLKEEKDWSKATGSELGGYFALDLQVLSQGLSCIPVYEQLRLPTHLFSDEEVKRFDMYAEKAKSLYSTFLNKEGVQRNTKEIILNKVNATDGEKSNVNSEVAKTYNILDLENATQNLQELSVETEKFHETIDLNDKSERNSSLSKSFEIKQDSTLNSETVPVNNKQFDSNQNNSNESFSFPNDIGSNNSSEKLINIQTISSGKPMVDTEKSSNQIEDTSEIAKEITQISSKIEITLKTDDVLSNKTIVDTKNVSEIKQKQTTKERKSPGRDLYINKVPDKSKDIKPTLEDDDDLDFLLSLKKPVAPQPVKDSEPQLIKESTHVPGGASESKQIQPQQHSELDDWLDSVLED